MYSRSYAAYHMRQGPNVCTVWPLQELAAVSTQLAKLELESRSDKEKMVRHFGQHGWVTV